MHPLPDGTSLLKAYCSKTKLFPFFSTFGKQLTFSPNSKILCVFQVLLHRTSDSFFPGKAIPNPLTITHSCIFHPDAISLALICTSYYSTTHSVCCSNCKCMTSYLSISLPVDEVFSLFPNALLASCSPHSQSRPGLPLYQLARANARMGQWKNIRTFRFQS